MTDTMILGLISTFGSMSGYDIQQMMKSSQTDKWANIQPASIYHSLKKLVTEECLILESVQQTGYRSKAIYDITPKGELKYQSSLIESFKELSVVFPTSLYISITFSKDCSQDELKLALDYQENLIMKLYDGMKDAKVQKEQLGKISKTEDLILQNIYEQCELQLKFLEKIRKALL
jgi:DNA-binding PadR family transcriptional regulator